ncbi:alpha/beta fold hydrolase [Streptomyces sp. NPDC005811]|uniref:alpha/beta hydrolase n=1 Tax=Streptomyces sp. NPDC005811 TaxID=3154565 RepID=UPI0034107A50
MNTFVLVHGAWHGGWVWRNTEAHLRAVGHHTYAPTLTGLSDRAHLLDPQVSLTTHVEDIVALIVAHDLREVVLVGHGYGGQVVTGAADRLAERLARRVHVDAFVGGDGDSAISLLPAAVAAEHRERVSLAGFGWLVPVPSAKALDGDARNGVDRALPRLTAQPWRSYTEPLSLAGQADLVPGVFVECTDGMGVCASQARRAAARGWPVHRVEARHDAMLTVPRTLVDVLLRIVGS